MARTARELGLERAPEVAPAQLSDHVLPSGLRIQWRMPDLFTVLSFSGALPDPITAAVIKLLVGEGSYLPEDDPRSWHHKAEHIKGVYGIMAAGMVKPHLDLSREWGDGNGTLGRRDICWADLEFCYYNLFRLGGTPPGRPLPTPDDTSGSQEPVPAGDDVPPAAE